MTTTIDPVITTNYGINRHADARADRELEATRHVQLQTPGADGYVDATAYNRGLGEWLGDRACDVAGDLAAGLAPTRSASN